LLLDAFRADRQRHLRAVIPIVVKLGALGVSHEGLLSELGHLDATQRSGIHQLRRFNAKAKAMLGKDVSEWHAIKRLSEPSRFHVSAHQSDVVKEVDKAIADLSSARATLEEADVLLTRFMTQYGRHKGKEFLHVSLNVAWIIDRALKKNQPPHRSGGVPEKPLSKESWEWAG